MTSLLLAAALSVAAAPAFAHTGAGSTTSFLAGLAHPMFGLDHVLAMVAVGLWAAQAGERLWLWPAAFVLAMLGGGVAGFMGAPLPAVEPMIVASVVLLGVAVALALPATPMFGAVVVAGFAVFHGHAHGAEASGVFAAYAAGFALATIALHAAGVGLGLAGARWMQGAAVRIAGGAVAAGGLALALT